MKFRLALFAFFVQIWSSYCQPESLRVALYDEWRDPVEKILTQEQLFDLIPRKQKDHLGAENNILLAIYQNEHENLTHNPLFVGGHYQTGPEPLHLASLNLNVYSKIISDWKLKPSPIVFIWIRQNSFYEDGNKFATLYDTNYEKLSDFQRDNRGAQITFINKHINPVKFYWYETDFHELATILPNVTRMENTFLGHVFVARDKYNNSLIDAFMITSPQETIEIKRTSFCEDKHISDLKQCDEALELDLIEWTWSFWARKREALNFVQPKILPNFTRFGYTLEKLNDSIYQPLLQFWQHEFNNKRLIEEHHAGPVLNQLESPTFMAHLHEKERQLLTNYLKPKLEQWSKISNLELTSLYGIRQYTRNAILGMHVDTCRTHVASGIINVASKLDEGKDWPLQIYDHEDNLHTILMKPGDVVFYESAKSGHARFLPLPGEWYANIFIHFAPTAESNVTWNFDWF